MEAIAIRLDGMETLAASSKAALGFTGTMQGDTSFSRVLDNAMKATDGVQNSAEYTKPQEKPYEKPVEKQQESVSADDSKIKQMVSESDKTEETAAQSAKTENNAEEKVAVSEENKTEEKVALAEAVDVENIESEETLALVTENLEIEDMAGEKIEGKKSKELFVENVMEPVLLNEENAEAVAEAAEDENGADGLVKKSSKKSAKNNEAAAVFSNVQAEKAKDVAKIDDELAADTMVHSSAVKKQEAPLIEVIDERTHAAENDKSSGLVTSVSYDENGTAEMQLNLANPQAQDLAQVQEGVPLQEGSKAAFASMLSSEIRNNAGEFVKTGLITLRDNKSGTINLVLHPEELGNVKIKLELSDKLITGKIIVSSEEAYSAFKNNIESLRQAFLSSGFENAGFELAWNGSGESEGRHDEAEQGKNPRGFDYADSMPLAAGAEDMPEGYFGLTSVNMVV